ncbi:hypothetical protein CLV51_104282 [Chitinophaga niastensis]|uniref:Uncharacterized protein n=1 Tax=Chitinophaga niastensis TaxID=536980 RepID=A0A2P8HHA1_CHINA|nr:hypothetical protein CLV51_104282 [Chitinophaga niastensis]
MNLTKHLLPPLEYKSKYNKEVVRQDKTIKLNVPS